MASIQPSTHSFVVKVWLSGSEHADGPVAWRGRITHVPSGRQRGVRDLAELGAFVAPYLHDLGVRPSWGWKARRWLRR